MSPVFEVGDAPPRKKKSNTLLILAILGSLGVCLLLVALASSVLLPVFSRARLGANRNQCLRNVRSIATASLMYAADFDGRMPLASGWPEAIKPFANRPVESIVLCPLVNRQNREQYGIAYNRAVAGKLIESIEDQEAPVAFDSTVLERGATAGVETLPKPGRHAGRVRSNCVSLLSGRATHFRDPTTGQSQ